MTIWVSPVVRIPTTRSRVDCGFGLVILSFWPTMRFSNVDFPAFGLPTTVTMPARCIEERYRRRMFGVGTIATSLRPIGTRSRWDAHRPRRETRRGRCEPGAGDGLLSRDLSVGVPSAL